MKKTDITQLESELEALSQQPDKGRSGKSKTNILIELANTLKQTDADRALEYAERALKLAEGMAYARGRIASCQIIGDLFMSKKSKDNFEQAIEHFSVARRIARKARDAQALARACNSIGIACAQLGDYDRAMSSYDECLRIRERIRDKRGIARVCYNLGVVSHYRNDHDQEREYFHKALQIAKEIGDKTEAAKTLCGIGSSHERQGNYEQALDYHLKALRMAQDIGSRELTAMSYGNAGSVHLCLGDKELALKYHLKALAGFEKLDIPHSTGFANNNIAYIYNKLGEYDKSLSYSLRALAIFEKIGDKRGLAAAHGNIGSVCRKKGYNDKALHHYLESLRISRESGQKMGVAVVCESLGKLAIIKRDYSMAEEYLSEGLQVAEEIGTKMVVQEIYHAFCEMHEARRDYGKALDYYRKYTVLKDELFNTEKARQIAQMRTKYETEQKEKEAELYRLRNLALRREIAKRRKVEQELQEHRVKLESIVARRTARLRAANIELREEIAGRKRVEKELLGYQKQLRALTYERGLIEERERRKVAAALHDDISQSLMIVKSALDALAAGRPGKGLRQKLEAIRSQVAAMIQRTRSMTFEISPPVLYELGLEPAVEWLVEKFQNDHGITCEYRDDGKAKPVSPDWRSILFQSARELLANVRKHARASKVLVSTAREGNRLRLVVADDGIGFDPAMLEAKIKKNEAFGLFNLRERMTHLRGDIDITSRQGQGTTITLLAPLKRNHHKTNRMHA